MAINHVWKAALGVGALLAGSVVAAAAPAGDPRGLRLAAPAADRGQLVGVPDGQGLTLPVSQSFAVATSCCPSAMGTVTDADPGRQVLAAARPHGRRQPVLRDAGRAPRPQLAAGVVATIPDPRPPRPHLPQPEPAAPQAQVPDDHAAQAGARAHGRDRSHAGGRVHRGADGRPSAARPGRRVQAPASGPDHVRPAHAASPGRPARYGLDGGSGRGGG